jgi:integrase
MAKIEKLPSGTYRTRVYYLDPFSGKNKSKSIIGSSPKEVRMNEAEFRLSLQKRVGQFDITVGEALNKFIDDHVNVLSPATIRGYISLKNNHYQSIKHIKAHALTLPDVQREINDMAANLSPKTIHNYYSLLTKALRYVKCPIDFECTFPQKVIKEMEIPTQEEVSIVLDSITNPDIKIAVLLAATLGLRRSEISGVQMSNIDFENRLITIDSAVVYDKDCNFVNKVTKNPKSKRTLEIPDILYDEIIKKKGQDGALVNRTPASISESFRKIVKKCPVKYFTLHQLRHFYASVMLKLNVPDMYAMRRMGHSTSKMLKSVYQHVFQDEQKKISSNINDFFNNKEQKQ